jgi:DNA primase small subunit
MEDIILQYTYPRLDAEVSKHRNHLLKAPFCVHPSTGRCSLSNDISVTYIYEGRVCVPVDPARVHEFDPEGVPTVGQLLRELNDSAVDGQPHHSGMMRCVPGVGFVLMRVIQIGKRLP